MSLKNVCETYGVDDKKTECDHNAINLQNWEE